MDGQFNDLNLIDLINAKQGKLRDLSEQMWNNTNQITVTSSEWFILSLIYGKQPTISEITQQVHISRQATHKCIKVLGIKNLIVIRNVENNNRNKCLTLTTLGEQYYLKNKAIKEEIEKNIISQIGSENVTLLKNLLSEEWS